MTNLKNVRYAMSVLAAVAAFGMVTEAKAQTQAFTATVTVQNALTLTHVNNLNFGTLAVARDSGQTSTIAISPAGVLGAPGTSGGTAYIAVIDDAAATSAEVTVEDGAPGSNVNVNIVAASITQPTFGGQSFALGTWTYSWNAGGTTAIVPDTPEVVVFDAAYNAGVNRLRIGATLTGTAGVTPYADGAYPGAFDVNFSY